MGASIKQIAVVVLAASSAMAHPADDPCPSDTRVSFGCQVVANAPHLGLQDPAFFKLHKQYWHCRRELEGTLKKYAGCVGAVNSAYRKRGWPEISGEPGCMNYHEIIPATPIVELPGDFVNARQQIEACEANTCGLHLAACEYYLRTELER